MGSGWKERRAAADKLREQRVADYNDDARNAIRAERAAMMEAARLRDEATAAAAAEARLRLRVSCPCCNGSPDGVLVSKAEKMMRAWASPLLSRAPDQWNMGHLNAVAVGQDTGAVIVPEGMFYPRAMAGRDDHRIADVPPADHGEPAVVTPKTEPVIPAKPKRKPTAVEIYAAGGVEGAVDLTDDAQ